eukprot:gnl/Hemi2/25685_TR8624_c0_g1_i1.p1 gnl/Hemi2/25685_TR8624_c0_g1~~gnl/Hemi2/25685_TR8624_c0_g1_i1.p1  ORF type:complete len:535 (+),score=204.76 gnl/Hemi2/25685_TR8624_c0_g1_i1:54-1658(+)
MSTITAQPAPPRQKGESFKDKDRQGDVRTSNIMAAKAVSDAVRTSLGPKGMDKMVQTATGEVLITNDGATIMKQLEVTHPAAKMLVELSKAQDIQAGDGTTSVVVVAGSLLQSCSGLLNRGIHPSVISDSLLKAVASSEEVLTSMAVPVNLNDREALLRACVTSLNSKVVSQNSNILAPLAVDAVLKVLGSHSDTTVDLHNIRVISKLGGTVDDTELVDGLVFPQAVSHAAGGPTRVENAKIALIQFCVSAPKTNMEGQVVVSDYQAMDRLLKEERNHLLNMCKIIQKSGCNVLLIQKSIMRDATNELALHFLAKMKIMVVKDVERDDIEFVSKTVGLTPIASIEGMSADKLGHAQLVEECGTSEGKVIKITGVRNPGRTVSVLLRASNKMMLEEADRSLHDALCVVRSLVKRRFLIAGGGAPEIECGIQLARQAKTLSGMESACFRAFADALEIIPYTLAENAGLNPINVVTDLRNRHVNGETSAGINVRKGCVTNILEENVVMPLLVPLSAISLAVETVRMILKIDDIVMTK